MGMRWAFLSDIHRHMFGTMLASNSARLVRPTICGLQVLLGTMLAQEARERCHRHGDLRPQRRLPSHHKLGRHVVLPPEDMHFHSEALMPLLLRSGQLDVLVLPSTCRPALKYDTTPQRETPRQYEVLLLQ